MYFIWYLLSMLLPQAHVLTSFKFLPFSIFPPFYVRSCNHAGREHREPLHHPTGGKHRAALCGLKRERCRAHLHLDQGRSPFRSWGKQPSGPVGGGRRGRGRGKWQLEDHYGDEWGCRDVPVHSGNCVWWPECPASCL